MHHHDVPDEDKTVVEAEMPVSSNIPGLNQALEAVSSLLSMIETLNLDTFVVQNAVKHTKEIQQILVDLRNSFQTYFESKDIDQADVSTLARDLVSPLIRLSSGLVDIEGEVSKLRHTNPVTKRLHANSDSDRLRELSDKIMRLCFDFEVKSREVYQSYIKIGEERRRMRATSRDLLRTVLLDEVEARLSGTH